MWGVPALMRPAGQSQAAGDAIGAGIDLAQDVVVAGDPEPVAGGDDRARVVQPGPDSGRHQRTGETAAPRLVRPGDEAVVEPAIEVEEPLAAAQPSFVELVGHRGPLLMGDSADDADAARPKQGS